MRSTELTGKDWIDSPQKRALDLTVAIGSLPIYVPIGAVSLGLSRIVDGKGALFTHQRIGQNGKRFTIAKVRTLKDIDPDVINTGVNDVHATALGKRLRLLGVDEIPQALNVLSGDMSVVGPRLLPRSGFEAIQQALSRNEYDEWLDIYYSSKPGGVSTYGLLYRRVNEGERNAQLRVQMDKEDFKNASLKHDLQLIRSAASIGIKLFMNQHRRADYPELPKAIEPA